jgi:hypothetical protein
VGVPVAIAGGQIVAHPPVHVTEVAVSLSRWYNVEPSALTTMLPYVALGTAFTVGAAAFAALLTD